MSRGFIDDNAVVLDTRSRLPDNTSTVYDPGHIYQDVIDGTRFVNKGSKAAGAIFENFPANRYELVERFLKRPAINADIAQVYTVEVARAANKDWEAVGTNITTALVTFSGGGGVVVTTAGADEDQGILTPHLDADTTAWAGTTWATDDKVIFETTIVTGASIADAIIWAGLKLTNDNVVATDNEQAFVRYENGVNSGAFQLITSDNGTDTTTNTTLTVAVSTSYHIKLLINDDFDVYLYINGVQYAAVSAALGTGHDLIPYVGVEASAAAAKVITCRGVRMSKDFND